MNHLIEKATGKLLSSTTLEITDVKPEHEVVVRPDGEERRAEWDVVQKIFVPFPEKRIIGKLDFVELFTDAELEALLGHPHIKVKVFIKKLELTESVDLKSARMAKVLTGLVSLGIITEERRGEILNG